MSKTFPFSSYFVLSLCIVVASAAFSQNSGSAAEPQPTASSADTQGSIAAAAKSSKASKANHAKKVFTDEDMEATTGPLPPLRMEGAENADQIVAAIAKYKTTHTPEQTEQAIRIWYDRYDEMLQAAIQEDQDLRALRDANVTNGYELCQQSQDYTQCRNRQMAEQRGAHRDQQQIASNSQLEVRIQHAFSKIRIGLGQNSLNYDWFKIRTTNGIDIF